MRARAEAEHANQLAERKEAEKRELAKNKMRREKFSSFYLKVSLLFLTGSGISGFSPGLPQIDWMRIGVGVLLCLAIGIVLLIGTYIDYKKNMKQKKSYYDKFYL